MGGGYGLRGMPSIARQQERHAPRPRGGKPVARVASVTAGAARNENGARVTPAPSHILSNGRLCSSPKPYSTSTVSGFGLRGAAFSSNVS